MLSNGPDKLSHLKYCELFTTQHQKVMVDAFWAVDTVNI
jgi:hypothetical protein